MSTMRSGSRKRVVSSCVPCYRKKQKCNRQYPCNHCTRRRRPEDCVYQPSHATQTKDRSSDHTPVDPSAPSQGASGNDAPIAASSDCSTTRNSTVNQESNSLAGLFGNVEHSESNTMALVRRLGLGDDDHSNGNRDIPLEAYDEIKKNIERLPGREVFDFLIQLYVTEVHWMEQLVYVPWFLGQYQKWWKLGRLSLVNDVEFVVLFLRMCAYASQFLPSPAYTVDRVRGMPLTEIRDACDDIADKLANICERLNTRGTLLRVQQLSFLGLQRQCEGRINAFWEALSNAVRVAQRIGLHRGRAALREMHEFEQELRCKVYCNLYIWDSNLSNQLDCNSFLAASLTSEHLPRVLLGPNVDDAGVPDDYLERFMQARLANFWRSFAPRQGADYDALVAEERYEKFCSEFLIQLPPVFALKPSEEWDERLQKLPVQRQMLHVALFDYVCHNFRPLLLREPSQVQTLPVYKQVLMASQRRTLAAAALKMLDSVSKLHALLGRSHTRFASIILPTFEAAVVLVSLTMDEQFPGIPTAATNLNLDLDLENERNGHADPLAWGKAHLTRDYCRRATQEALARLEMLAEVSNMAETSAHTLARLMAKMPTGDVAPSAFDNFFAAYSTATLPGLYTELQD